MSTPSRSGGPAGSADDDFVVVLVAAGAATALFGSVGVLWLRGVD